MLESAIICQLQYSVCLWIHFHSRGPLPIHTTAANTIILTQALSFVFSLTTIHFNLFFPSPSPFFVASRQFIRNAHSGEVGARGGGELLSSCLLFFSYF